MAVAFVYALFVCDEADLMTLENFTTKTSTILEFDTTLSAAECCARLKKLPKKMAYLKAKAKLELVNSTVGGDLIVDMVGNDRCEFRVQGRVRYVGLVVFFIGYVQSVEHGSQVTLGRPSRQPLNHIQLFRIGFFLFLCVYLVVLNITNGDIQAVLCLSTVIILILAFFYFSGKWDVRRRLELFRIILTEPDEDNL